MRFSFVLCAALIILGGRTYGAPAPAVTVFGVSMTIDPHTGASTAETGIAVTFTAVATGGTGGLTYQWKFGDGLTTSFDAANVTVNHTYTQGGHFLVRVNVEDVASNTTFEEKLLTVHFPITAVQPTNSSTVILAGGKVWCVNPDQDTVSAINATTHVLLHEPKVGQNPRTLARAGDGTIWVVSQQHPSISVLDPNTAALLHVIPLPHGSLPYGICMTPDGSAAYVTFQGSGGVQKISTSTRAVLASSTVPPSARGVSVSATGRVFVTRFISPQSSSLKLWNSPEFLSENRGEVVELSPSLGFVRTIKLVIDPGQPGGTSGDPDFGNNSFPSATGSRGVPNYLTSMVISPDGRRAWVPSKKDNIQRGEKSPERDGLTPSSEITYRAIVSSIDLTSSSKTLDEIGERLDVDNAEMPQAACLSPLGDFIFIALQGNNRVQVRDAYDRTRMINGLGDSTLITPTGGLSPQGVVLDPVSKKLFVHNYMGRTISVFDATAVLASNGAPSSLVLITNVATIVGGDNADLLRNLLDPLRDALTGKRVFYNADDGRMSRLGYISCAGCHLDGGADMRVFDFTNRGEGFRNTVMLQGRGGTAMGNVHWSANFDEIQDFDNDVFARFHDAPPAPPSFTGNPGTPFSPMGVPNTGRDNDLDAMSTYVSSLKKVSRSPFRKPDGALTAQGAAGEAVFKAQNCQKCHSGRNFTDSQVGTILNVDVFPPPAGQIIMHNVGTIRPTSGQRLFLGTLPGVDTPTLKGVWQTAPYLHDGSAATILDVFTDVSAPTHFKGPLTPGNPTMTPQERLDLARYMIEIDEIDAPPSTGAATTVTLGAVATGRPYSLAAATLGLPAFVDRSYAITSLPAPLPGKVLLRTAEDDKNSGTGSLLSFTLTSAADVYVFYDNRAGVNKPTWLDASWTASAAQNVTLTPNVQMNAFKRTFAAGVTVTLGGNVQGGLTGALRNYFVIIDQAGAVFEEGPLSQKEWVHDHDGDGDGLRDEFEVVSALLDPWNADTGSGGTIPDEDKPAAGGVSQFQSQIAFDAVVPTGGGGGGGGGCGFAGLEPFVLLVLIRILRKRREG